MPKYRFRLQALRQIRQIHRDEARLKLAQAHEAEQILAQRQRALADELAQLRRSQRQLCGDQVLDVHQILQTQRYQMALQSQGAAMSQQSEKVREEVERRREAVVEADRQVRVLDRLEERQRADHRRQEEAVEIKRLDEVGATRRGESL